ncbi:MAG: cation:proton antiporter [Candidatus Synoicihabitans palmerolidicus]|nr:cation:proton antiporter [Candidatus Synoicihabitans palmerolidicus]
MDGLLIAIAFLFGLIAQQIRLPPLVGFLVAGFVLSALGKTGGATLDFLADLGVTLMLFPSGLNSASAHFCDLRFGRAPLSTPSLSSLCFRLNSLVWRPWVFRDLQICFFKQRR